MTNKIEAKPADNKVAPTEAAVINLYAAADKIYPRSTFGFFTKWRWVMIWLTQLVFYGTPWLEWGQRQALLFDLEARRFYIFKSTTTNGLLALWLSL